MINTIYIVGNEVPRDIKTLLPRTMDQNDIRPKFRISKVIAVHGTTNLGTLSQRIPSPGDTCHVHVRGFT